MAAHPPHCERLGGDGAPDTPDNPRRADLTVRSACCGELARTGEHDLFADLMQKLGG